MEEKYGLEYFPYIELYTEMGLPILDGMQQLWKMDMQAIAINLKNKQMTKVKKNHIDHKVVGVEEQLKWKQWAKRQRIINQYGVENSDSDNEIANEALPTIKGRQLKITLC